jgi:hypothetical protein
MTTESAVEDALTLPATSVTTAVIACAPSGKVTVLFVMLQLPNPFPAIPSLESSPTNTVPSDVLFANNSSLPRASAVPPKLIGRDADPFVFVILSVAFPLSLVKSGTFGAIAVASIVIVSVPEAIV